MNQMSSPWIAAKMGTILSLSGFLACTQQADATHRGTDAGSPQQLDALDGATADAMVAADEASVLREAGAPAGPRASLVSSTSWTELAPAEDPFDDRPPTLTCALGAIMPESLAGEDVFSVDTGRCNYVTVTQPTLRAVALGETLKVRLWHFELTASEPAEAHAAVVLDGLTILDARVPIPHPGELIVGEVRVERAIPAGTPVYFHLHNHGANSWSLVEVSAGP